MFSKCLAFTAIVGLSFSFGQPSEASPYFFGKFTAHGFVNVASAANGGLASASSTYSSSFPTTAANNGDRLGQNWGSGGGWNSTTDGNTPAWVEIDFNGLKTIREIDVFNIQDNYNSPSTPTRVMTFSNYGLYAFKAQYWNGSSWLDVPGASVTSNNLVWNQFSFTPIATAKIRIYMTSGGGSYMRVAEIEAWGS